MPASYAEKCLPFPRGQAMNADALLTMSTTVKDDLEGRVYTVPDTIHGTGRDVKLMPVRNATGGAITVARKFAEITAEVALGWGKKITTFPCNTAGAVALPLD
ncbi:unnamed protein product, partial [marine sediment metagenome]